MGACRQNRATKNTIKRIEKARAICYDKSAGCDTGQGRGQEKRFLKKAPQKLLITKQSKFVILTKLS